jgi:hypothetical protein
MLAELITISQGSCLVREAFDPVLILFKSHSLFAIGVDN